MSIRLRNRKGLNITALIMLALGFASVGAGQTTTTDEVTPEADKTPEEIIVYGEKSTIILRNELYRAEESFFTVFNSLNSDNNFDVKCEKITVNAERRRYHICRPKFALKREAEQTREAMLSADHGPIDLSATAGTANANYVRRMNRQMWAEMATLVKEHPELQEELARLQEANQALNADRQRK